MKKMVLRLVLSGLLLIAILVLPVSVFAVTGDQVYIKVEDQANDQSALSAQIPDQVYIKVEDPCCKGYSVYVDGAYILTEGGSGNPDGCCAFYVSRGTHKFELRKGGYSTSKSWYCLYGTVYTWVSMPCGWCGDCQVYIQVDDNTCAGFDVYVDGAYILTEGASGNPDGECAFHVSRGTHKFELRKGGYTTSKSWYCNCDTVYTWVSMPDYWCGCQIDVEIADDTCIGYLVYVDGVYKLAEDQDGYADGYCTFPVDKGTHTIMITKNGRSESITKNFECGTPHRWDSMPEHWCGDPCDQPPTVTFDKTNYYAGDTVQATVSTSFSSVYYQIKDCPGLVLKEGSTSNGGTIYYTLPAVVTECCNWQICLYWGSGMELQGTGSECTESYDFWVCSPPEIFEDLIFLSGPVNATITDQYGRVIDDTGINQIPNARVVSIGAEKKFFIPSDLDYTVDIKAYDSGELTYGQSSPRGKDLVCAIAYLNVLIEAGSEALVLEGSINIDGKVIFPDGIEIQPSIQLHTGWNLISLPKIQEASDVLDVMQMVGYNLNSVWTYEDGIWKRYDLTGPSFLNDLITMEPGKGYWIDMESDDCLDELYLTGSELTDKSIPVASGWNLVGYNSLNSTSVTDAMDSVPGNWNSVWTYENGKWKRYDLLGEVFLNDLETLVPGKGYWIDMKSDATWTLGA